MLTERGEVAVFLNKYLCYGAFFCLTSYYYIEHPIVCEVAPGSFPETNSG